MTFVARWFRSVLLIAVFFVVGGGLVYTGYRITPDINDRSIPLGEWRSRNRVGSAVSALGEVSLVLGALFIWAVARRATRQQRRHSHATHNPDSQSPS